MLEAVQFSKRFGQEILWEKIALQLPNHGLGLIFGPSGTGKTTFLKAINQLTGYQGSLRFQGVELNRLTPEKRLLFRQHYVGSVYQHGGLMTDLTVNDHLQFIKQIKGDQYSPPVQHALNTLLNEINLNQKIITLSKGQQQRLAIILACTGQPKLLLLDEPTAGLDWQNRQKIYQLLNVLKPFMLILMSTHLLDQDNIPADFMIQFPLEKSGSITPTNIKNQLPPATLRTHFKHWWLSGLLFRHRRTEPLRWRLSVFQSFALGLFGVSIALSFLLHREILTLTKTMLGGEYQHLTPVQSETSSLASTTRTTLHFLPASPGDQLGEVYDSQYFEDLKPYHQFYFDYRGIRSPLSGFHLGLINKMQYLPWSDDPTFMSTSLTVNEVVLGVQAYHLKQLGILLDCFPTMQVINHALSQQPLAFYLTIAVPDWGYQDESFFILKAIISTSEPTWFHDDILHPFNVYETQLRLPSKGIEEVYERQPWYVGKTMMIWTQDHPRLLSQWRTSLLWQHLHLVRHHDGAWRIYQTDIPRLHQPNFLGPHQPFHFHSASGYHYYPDQRLSGFANLVVFSPLVEIDQRYLDAMMSLKEPLEWLQVPPPPSLSIGHVLAATQSAIKYMPLMDLNPLNLNEIAISSTLAKTWKIQVGEVVQVATPRYQQHRPWGIVDDFITTHLTIKKIIEGERLTIFQAPYWWENWLMVNADVPSHELNPEAWISFQSIVTPTGYISKEPYREIRQQVGQLQTWIYGFMIGLGVVFMIPSLSLLWYYLMHHLTHDQPRMQLMMGYGASVTMIQQWYMMRLIWMMVDIMVPSLALFLTIDYLLKKQIYLQFSLQSIPSFPFGPIGVFLFVMLILTVMIGWVMRISVKQLIHRFSK